MGIEGHHSLATLATEAPDPRQMQAAAAVCVVATAVTVGFMAFAATPGPQMPGFFFINQTAIIVAYGLSAWTLFAQFRRGRSLPLLLMAGGTLYTAAIVLLQLLSLPGVVVAGRLLGNGPETTIWLWTFWHLGPPLCAIAYAVALGKKTTVEVPAVAAEVAAAATALVACAIAALAGAASTLGLPYLPQQVIGDNYWPMVTSGIGPIVQILTIVALALVWRATRTRRTVLDLWIAVSLFLLVLDNFLTQVGAARATLGWQIGRIEALVSAFAILWAYLHELDSLRAKAEAATAEVLRVEATLRQAQKMEAIGSLTGGIAHDFNNLLMVASSGFDIIRRKPEDIVRVVKTAEAGLQAVERGAKLTRQLLTFARRQALKPVTINLNGSLIDFEPLARRAVGEAVDLRLQFHPGLHPVEIDRSEFEAAILNLVMNGRDALPPTGGEITISTRNAFREEGWKLVDREQKGQREDHVVVTVIDNGFGMDDVTKARAFEPFFTTKEFGRGSGLGLSQVYGFAQASGGFVEITSTPGQGTKVDIWLPRAKLQTAPAPAPTIDLTSPLRRAADGETILAVEDEPAVLAAVVENLADLGYTVFAAQNAAEALVRLKSEERVDILFSDVVMPGGMNGVQLATEANRVRPGIRILLTSGYTDEALTRTHDVPPNLSILPKPYRRDELAARLKVARVS